LGRGGFEVGLGGCEWLWGWLCGGVLRNADGAWQMG